MKAATPEELAAPTGAGRVPTLTAHATQQLALLSWPASRLGEALELLARRAGLHPRAVQGLVPPASAGISPVQTDRWLEWAAGQLDIELEAVDSPVPELGALLDNAGPALLRWTDSAGVTGFLLLPGGRRGVGRGVTLLAPDLCIRRCERETLRQALCWSLEAPLGPEIDALLDQAGVPARRRARVQAALLHDRLASRRVHAGWLLRLPPRAPAGAQLRQARLPQRVLMMVAALAALYGLEVGAWALIGEGVLDGRLDRGWLAAWLLLLLAMLPLQLLGGWFNGSFALGAARLLKARLLAGALRLDPDLVRRQGVGGLLGRVIEAQALESLALGGALAVLVGLLEGVVAGWVLAHGAAPMAHGLALAGWLALAGALLWHWWRHQRAWTLSRLAMTHELIEQMVGHRTRLAQERPARRDAHDDASLHAYLQQSAAMDGASVPLQTLLPSGWIVLALAVMAPVLAARSASPAVLAVSLGGILLAQRALGSLASGLASLGRAVVAWQQVAELYRAGAGADAPGAWLAAPPPAPVLVDAQGLRFAHAGAAPVLQGLDLRIAPGDRLLLEGASGSGKSTLAALLTGLRQPQAGLLLMQGLDAPTLGAQWQAMAGTAPQFHENHVLSGSVAFNLLMGRQWPAGPAALAEAQSVCDALGLGELLQRMPAGLHQRIGETGWQLSHGERSRLFLARALLQGAPLTVLDESFAALDPETLARCLRAVQQRTQTLVVIAHP